MNELEKENIFGVNKPDEWHCRMVGYATLHNTMAIIAKHPNKELEPFLVTFRHVTYFSGTTNWVGANFCRAEMRELLNLWRIINTKIQALSDEELEYKFDQSALGLYVVKTSYSPFHIIANWGTKHDDVYPYELEAS
jgi:hypothetical protein